MGTAVKQIGLYCPDRGRHRQDCIEARYMRGLHRRIVEAFLEFLRDRWLDEITLNDVAEAVGVTVQTVIRRFSGKEGLLKAAVEVMKREIDQRREAPQGELRQIVEGLVRDYEETGDMVIRCLAQEERNPALKIMLDVGRREHLKWITESFQPWLEKLPSERCELRMAELLAITDVYTWKLLRRDQGKTREEFAGILMDLISTFFAESGDDTRNP